VKRLYIHLTKGCFFAIQSTHPRVPIKGTGGIADAHYPGTSQIQEALHPWRAVGPATSARRRFAHQGHAVPCRDRRVVQRHELRLRRDRDRDQWHRDHHDRRQELRAQRRTGVVHESGHGVQPPRQSELRPRVRLLARRGRRSGPRRGDGRDLRDRPGLRGGHAQLHACRQERSCGALLRREHSPGRARRRQPHVARSDPRTSAGLRVGRSRPWRQARRRGDRRHVRRQRPDRELPAPDAGVATDYRGQPRRARALAGLRGQSQERSRRTSQKQLKKWVVFVLPKNILTIQSIFNTTLLV